MAQIEDKGDPDADVCFICSNRVKDCCKKFIAFISCIGFLISIALGGYGYTSVSGASFTPTAGDYKANIDIPSSGVAAALCLVGCILGVLISLTGFCLIWKPNPCFAIIYFVIAFIVGILAFAAGGAVMSGTVSEKFVDVSCNQPFIDGKTGSEIAKEQYGKYVDDVMCSSVCPCTTTNYNVLYDTYNSTYLAGFDRKLNNATNTNENAAFTKMKTIGTGGVSIYMECYNKTISKATEGNTCANGGAEDGTGCSIDASDSTFKEFVQKGGVRFMTDFEAQFDCAGLCKAPLFYLTKDINLGAPKRDCVTAFKDEYADNTPVGIVAIFTGLLLLMAAFGAIPLCKDYNTVDD